jgi:hypothetical protein
MPLDPSTFHRSQHDAPTTELTNFAARYTAGWVESADNVLTE